MILFNLLRVERLRKLLIYQIFRYFKKSRSQGLEKGQTEKAELSFMPTILQISKICKYLTLCRPFHTAASNYLVVGSSLPSIFTCGRFLFSCEHSKSFWSMYVNFTFYTLCEYTLRSSIFTFIRFFCFWSEHSKRDFVRSNTYAMEDLWIYIL